MHTIKKRVTAIAGAISLVFVTMIVARSFT